MSNSAAKPLFDKILKDPLFHFFILGSLLFGAVSIWGTNLSTQDDIVITKAGQQHVADLFELTWQRKPTAVELENLVEEHIKEEVFYREALALGLDDNDTIVRRRLRQKLEFMQEDLSSLEEPTEGALKAYFDDHKDQYKTDRILSFQQILISPKKLDAREVAELQVEAKLVSGSPPASLNRSSLLPVSMKFETERTIISTFGSDFMQQITGMQMHEWGGPIYSGFGTHFVNISLVQPAKPLTFEQARNKVNVNFIQSQREAAANNYYKNLRSQYRISIEKAE